MSFGRVSGYLFAAREAALRHDCTSTRQRMAVEALVAAIDTVLFMARKMHLRTVLMESG